MRCIHIRACVGDRGSVDRTAEIIAVGNELLLGDVLDTNSHLLCVRLTRLGVSVRQVCQIRDEIQPISEALSGALGRGTDLIMTIGGLGPTDDDLTLAGVSRALGTEMSLHPLALEWVRAKYEALARKGYVDSAEMTPPRVKMARLPAGARPLMNRVGAAPGVFVQEGDHIIVSLPGVPAELKDIFEGALYPALREWLGDGLFLEWKVTVNCGDESILAPLLRLVATAHPKVYVKSRARHLAASTRFLVTLSTRGQDREEVASLLNAAAEELEKRLGDAGIEMVSLERA